MASDILTNRPYLTVWLVNVSMSGDVGPDIEISLEVDGGGTVTVGEKSPPKRLLRRKDQAVGSGVSSYLRPLAHSVLERDPVYPDSSGPGSTDLTISARAGSTGPMPAYAEHAVTLSVADAYEGPSYGYRSAAFTLAIRSYLTADLADVITYIGTEIEVNKVSAETAALVLLNKLANCEPSEAWLENVLIYWPWGPEFRGTMKALAYAFWTLYVGPGSLWDHKGPITAGFGEYALDADNEKLYRYDIWSKLHYGYVGRVAGFTRTELLRGAALAQVISDTIEDVREDLRTLGLALVSSDGATARDALGQLIEDDALRGVLESVSALVTGAGDEGADQAAIQLGLKLHETMGDDFENDSAGQARLLALVRASHLGGPPVKKDAPERNGDEG